MEAVKRIWIDILIMTLQNYLIPKFGEVWKISFKRIELTKHWNNIANVVLQSVNLPSKEEIDEVYKEIHSLKKE